MHDDAFKNSYSEYVTFLSSIWQAYDKSSQDGNQLIMPPKHLHNKSIEYWNKNLNIFLTPGNHIRFIFSWPWNLKYEKSLNLTVHWKSLYPILMIIWFVFILMVVTFFSIIWSILLYSSWGLKRSMGVKKSCISWIQTRVDF